MTKIEFKKYCWLMNRIAHWLIINKKNVFTANKYTFFGKSKTLKEIKQIINKNGTDYGSDVFVTRFVEYAIMHTNTYKNFPTSVYAMNDTTKLSREQYIAMVKKVWEYERKNKKPPVFVEVPTIKKYKKYGRSTQYGCNNRGQNTGYFCGPHMLQEIFRNLTGIVVTQSTIAGWAGTTEDGTDHQGLETAVEIFNKIYHQNLQVTWMNFSELGWDGLNKILTSTNQDAGVHELYRGIWGHYTNFDRILNGYAEVHNSLGDSCERGCYCGYTEERSLSTAKSYLSGISQKSIMVVTNAG